jgi:hypothetical protein
MTNNENQPGVIFFAVTNADTVYLFDLNRRLEAAGIRTEWSDKEWRGENVPALSVFENGNVVAGYLNV